MSWEGEIQFYLYTRLTEREMDNLLTQTSALLFLGLCGRQLMKGSLYDKKTNLKKLQKGLYRNVCFVKLFFI